MGRQTSFCSGDKPDARWAGNGHDSHPSARKGPSLGEVQADGDKLPPDLHLAASVGHAMAYCRSGNSESQFWTMAIAAGVSLDAVRGRMKDSPPFPTAYPLRRGVTASRSFVGVPCTREGESSHPNPIAESLVIRQDGQSPSASMRKGSPEISNDKSEKAMAYRPGFLPFRR